MEGRKEIVLHRFCRQHLTSKNTCCRQSADTATLQAHLMELAEACVDALLQKLTSSCLSAILRLFKLTQVTADKRHGACRKL